MNDFCLIVYLDNQPTLFRLSRYYDLLLTTRVQQAGVNPPLPRVLNFHYLFVYAEMDVTSHLILSFCIYLAAALIGGASAEGACLQDGKHKATPSPEPYLTECGLYADSE